jgi:UDP-N-acetylglucosamine 2-epimerase (non-hydrolysing)
MEKLKVMTIFGTRPEAIKMCPVILEMQKFPEYIQPIVAVTAQHQGNAGSGNEPVPD